jgi:uncharacterized membrane protein (UPF0182 family)
MQSATQSLAPASKNKLWAGRIITGLVVLFMLFDGIAKLFKPAPVVQAFAQLGYPLSLAVSVGVLLLICTVIYAIPRTAVLGAILLTGYLGGAVATQVRISAPAFPTVFPIIFGVLVWAGIFLREDRLRVLIPVRS